MVSFSLGYQLRLAEGFNPVFTFMFVGSVLTVSIESPLMPRELAWHAKRQLGSSCSPSVCFGSSVAIAWIRRVVSTMFHLQLARGDRLVRLIGVRVILIGRGALAAAAALVPRRLRAAVIE